MNVDDRGAAELVSSLILATPDKAKNESEKRKPVTRTIDEPVDVDKCIASLLAHPRAGQLMTEVSSYFKTISDADPYSALAVFASEEVQEIDSVLVYLIKNANRLVELGQLVSTIENRIGLNGLSNEQVLGRLVIPSVHRIADAISKSKFGKNKFILYRGDGKDVATIKVAIKK